MSGAWALLFVPGTLALLAVILFMSALVENRFLSPRSLIAGAVRSRRNSPEHAEALVVREYERLMRTAQGRLPVASRVAGK
jgi:hypothetical protein